MSSKTVEELEAVAPRIWYEWTMLRWAYEHLQPFELMDSGLEPFLWEPAELCDANDIDGPGVPDMQGSATLECFLLHIRVLRDFLSRPRSSHDDDVLAIDFFEDDWSPPEVGESLKAVKEQLDKALAHLSYIRIVYLSTMLWDHHGLFADMSEMWGHFWSSLPDQRKTWFLVRR